MTKKLILLDSPVFSYNLSYLVYDRESISETIENVRDLAARLERLTKEPYVKLEMSFDLDEYDGAFIKAYAYREETDKEFLKRTEANRKNREKKAEIFKNRVEAEKRELARLMKLYPDYKQV